MQKMNQQNYYSYPKKSIVSQLINTLHHKNIENHQYQLSKILKHKKAKLRQKYSLSSHEVIQPELCPPRPLYPPFTLIPPSCIGQEFISEKIKNNILRPERFYSSQPNVKAGSFSLPKKRSLQQNKIVVNNQFQEYSRIYDQQSGEFKHKKIIEMLGSNDLASKKQKYMRMKRTLFQKFMPDKYHFYNKIPGFNQKSLESSGLKKSLSKYVGIQQQKSMDDVKSYFKPGSSRQRNALEILEKPKEIIELKRSMSGRKPHFTKNLQSLQ